MFESRAAAFAADNVLQENVILLAEKGGEPAEVALTASSGADFAGTVERRRPYRALIEDSSGDHLVRVTSSQTDQDLVEALDALPFRFRDLGLEISTGPLVTFRATRFLRYEQADNTAPLLWMHNVRPFVTRFPPANAKPNHILNSAASRRLLVPARRYVLLKRFTAKEERRRLVAGIVQPTDCYSEWLGLENHLNYVHRGNAELREDEAYGLAAYFNSELLDRYFRTISGNTQVNAAEIRALPMPSAVTLSKIGAEVLRQGVGDRAAFERLIGRAVGLPEQVIVALGGADA